MTKKAEDKETYSLTLSEPQGAKLGDQTSVTTAITDKGTTPPTDDAQVKAINAPTAEEGQPLVYEVTVDTPKADTTVTLTLKSGTATLGTDTGTPIETSTDGGQTWQTVTPDASGNFTATVPAGSDKGVQVRVPTVVDTEVEGKETLTLEAATKGQTTPVSGEGTIADQGTTPPADDAQVKAINAPTAEEGQPLVYEVTVDTPKVDTTVTLTLKSGTATLGTDTGTPVKPAPTVAKPGRPSPRTPTAALLQPSRRAATKAYKCAFRPLLIPKWKAKKPSPSKRQPRDKPPRSAAKVPSPMPPTTPRRRRRKSPTARPKAASPSPRMPTPTA